MPRAEVGTPKWLANKMRSKGLQRLRWYCQMCEKQCRDENGFKCHRMSEGHQRQMQVFSQRANRYMDEFSREFEGTFMQLMRTRYCRTRILANTVYCDLIADKSHIHMNATIWSTLSEFVLYLKRTEKCKVEHTEQGWYLEYIDKERIEREKREDAKRREEVTAEQRREKILKRQIEAAWKESRDNSKPVEIKSFQRQNGEDITISLPSVHPIHTNTEEKISSNFSFSEAISKGKNVEYISNPEPIITKRQTALERLVIEQEQRKKKRRSDNDAESSYPLQSNSEFKEEENHPSVKLKESTAVDGHLNQSNTSLDPTQIEDEELPWLKKYAIVKVNVKELSNGKYYKQKGQIQDIKDTFVAKVLMLHSGDILLLDQQMLEPVIPGIGGTVIIIRGNQDGCIGHVTDVDIASNCVSIKLKNGTIQSFPLNYVCKIQL